MAVGGVALARLARLVGGQSAYLAVLIVVPLAVAWILPRLLERIWGVVERVPGSLHEKLLELSQLSRHPLPRIRVWPVGDFANAYVLGVFRSSQVLLLTRGLLTACRDEEVLAIVAHELGHIARRHAFYRVGWCLLPLLVAIACSGSMGIEGHGVTAIACFFGMLAGIAWYVGFGLLSHCCERDADVWAVELLAQKTGCSHKARSQYLQVLWKLSDRPGHGTWLHPSYWNRAWNLHERLRPKTSKPLRSLPSTDGWKAPAN